MPITLAAYAAKVAELRSLQIRHEYSGNQSLVHSLRWLEKDIDRLTAEVLAAENPPPVPPAVVPPDVDLGDSNEYAAEWVP